MSSHTLTVVIGTGPSQTLNGVLVATITSNLSSTVQSVTVGAPGRGVPTGGLVGQSLVKNSSANYDTKWEDTPPQVTSYTSGENLSAGRAVIVDGGVVRYFQPSNTAHAGRLLGVTKTAVTAPSTVVVQINGILQDAAFSFTDGPVFVRADGELFNSPLSSGLVQQVGTAVASNKLLINISPTFRRT